MSNKLQSGQALLPNQELTCPNSKFSLKMQADGNLVLYRNSNNQALWATGTAGMLMRKAIMEPDGNFCLETPNPLFIKGVPGGPGRRAGYIHAWDSHTHGHPNATIQLTNDGNIVISTGEAIVWSTGSIDKRDRLQPGEELLPNEELASADLKYSLKMQADGNLALYRNNDNKILWSTGTAGTLMRKAIMEPDGNFCLEMTIRERGGRGDTGGPIQPNGGFIHAWDSKTHEHPGSTLVVQNDGNLVIYNGATAVWDILSPQIKVATDKINDFHRRTGKNFGPLGAPVGSIVRSNDGSFEQNFQLGSIQLADYAGSCTSTTRISGSLVLSAVKCFDTEDPGLLDAPRDEIYLIISAISTNPNNGGVDQLVFTNRTAIQNNVAEGGVIFEEVALGKVPAIVGSGLKIHVAIYDHEYGDADKLRDKISEIVEAAAKTGASALAGGAAGDDASLSGPVGDIIDFEIAGVKPFKWITFGIADGITEIFKDDLIDEHVFIIPASTVAAWSQQADDSSFPELNRSFRTNNDIHHQNQYNIPLRVEDEIMFEGGGGSYKVYLKFIPTIEIQPCIARIS